MMAFCTPLSLSLSSASLRRSVTSPAKRPAFRRSSSLRVSARLDTPDTKETRTPTPSPTQTSPNTPRADVGAEDYAVFAEQVNGRVAMLAFVTALLTEAASGVTINHQIEAVLNTLAGQVFLFVAPLADIIITLSRK